jgi:arsenate reductase-like glutaredoxin family protein
MIDREWLSLALARMHTGQWFGWKKDWTGEHRMSYENIIVHDSSITKPTEAEIDAKIQELKDAEQAKINKKASAIQKLKNLGLDDDEIKAIIGGL